MAPLLGELSSASETEGSPGLWECRWGKEWAVVRPVFSGLHRVPPRRPLRRFATMSKSALKTKLTCHSEERSDVAIRIPLGLCKVLVRRKENGFPRRASPSSE